MGLLNDATNIYAGATPVNKVMVGSVQVWPQENGDLTSELSQQNSGAWSGVGATVSLPAAAASSSCVVLIIAASGTITTPAGWSLRTSQVNWMGHYLFTVTGTTASSWSVSAASGTVGTWWIAELANTTYDTSASSNDTGGAIMYTTPALVPTAGKRMMLTSVAGINPTGDGRSISSWTNSFTEIADLVYPTGDKPMQGVATRTVTTDGVASYGTTATYNDFLYGKSAIIASFTMLGSGGGDQTAPSIPTGLAATVVGSSQINLTWNASTDNVGVDHYTIYRDGAQIATTGGTSYPSTGLSASTQYSYTVSAVDAAGNASAQSSAILATTSDGDPGGAVTHGQQITLANTGHLAYVGPNDETYTDGDLFVYNDRVWASDVVAAGHTEGVWFKDRVEMDVPVTFTACRFDDQAITYPYTHDVVLNYCTISPPTANGTFASSLGAENITANRCQILGSMDGVNVAGSTPVTCIECYIRVKARDDDDHNDGIQAYGCTGGGVFLRNNVDCRPVSGGGGANAAFFVADNSQGEFIVRDNYFAGGGYVVRLLDAATYRVTGNIIEKDSYLFGPVLRDNLIPNAILEWSNNTLSDGTVIN